MNKGFTLIELSIVLVIISLIVAGITGGKALIKQSELHSLTKDIQKTITAVNTFRLQYDFLPGDIPNAHAYWGVAGTGAPGGLGFCNETIVSQANQAGCNGNGDGRLYAWNTEGVRAWQHLALADMMEGKFTGRFGVSGVDRLEAGTNILESKRNGAALWFYTGDGGNPLYGLANSNAIRIGTYCDDDCQTTALGSPSADGDSYSTGAVTPSEARSIDIKTDDGKPDKGFTFTEGSWGNILPCLIAGPTLTYNVANSDEESCMVTFLIGARE